MTEKFDWKAAKNGNFSKQMKLPKKSIMSIRIIGGLFRGRMLKAPKGDQTRPTTSIVREALFNICREQVINARFLDLFAGSGSIGFEALSQGASWVTFVEQDRNAASSIRENIASLQVADKTELLVMPALAALKKLSMPYELIYVDPPYENGIADTVLQTIVDRNLLSQNGSLFLEERYDPKKKSPEFTGLKLLSSRRYGIAQLHEFILN